MGTMCGSCLAVPLSHMVHGANDIVLSVTRYRRSKNGIANLIINGPVRQRLQGG